MTTLVVHTRRGTPEATAEWKGQTYPALVGKNGPVEADLKREGDGHTPLGRYPLLLGFFREDRRPRPTGTFPWRAIQPGDCFSDDPTDPLYNHVVWQGHPATATGTFWKEGHEYDAIAWIGYNVGPIIPGKGSAVLLHGWRTGASFSGGCVVLPNDVLATLADQFTNGDDILIQLTEIKEAP